MKNIIVSNHIDNVTNELYGSLMLARSEAIKRKQTVSLCSTLDHQTCDENSSGWHHGWLIFSDENSDGLINSRDQLLRRFEKQSDLITIVWNRGYGVRFNSRGQTSQAGTFRICDQKADRDSKAIVISMTGRLRTEENGACN